MICLQLTRKIGKGMFLFACIVVRYVPTATSRCGHVPAACCDVRQRDVNATSARSAAAATTAAHDDDATASTGFTTTTAAAGWHSRFAQRFTWHFGCNKSSTEMTEQCAHIQHAQGAHAHCQLCLTIVV